MKNKRGWIKIVEAFISILIIISVVLIVYDGGSTKTEDLSSQVYPIERAILKEVEFDSNLRESILEVPTDKLPLDWEKFEENGLAGVKEKINGKVVSNLNCVAKVCALDENICDLNEYIEKDVYAQSISIVANSDIYSPKQLKIFCYTK
jgi:hypothetical protein